MDCDISDMALIAASFLSLLGVLIDYRVGLARGISAVRLPYPGICGLVTFCQFITYLRYLIYLGCQPIQVVFVDSPEAKLFRGYSEASGPVGVRKDAFGCAIRVK